MKWDAKKRRYVENGRVLTKAEVRKHIDEYVTHQQKEVERESNKLFIGAVSVGAFFEFLRHKITAWHSLAGSTAYGGPKNTTSEQWKRINQKILSELAYLNKFELEAQASFETAQTVASQVVTVISNQV